MRKHDVQDCLNDTYLRFILPKALGKRTIIRKMRFPNDQESILSQVLRIFLIFHLRSLPRIKYFIHQQLYFYRFLAFYWFPHYWHLKASGQYCTVHFLDCSQGGTIWVESNNYEASSQLLHTTPFRRLIHLFITRAQAIGRGHGSYSA